jgi:hypothetical protein
MYWAQFRNSGIVHFRATYLRLSTVLAEQINDLFVFECPDPKQWISAGNVPGIHVCFVNEQEFDDVPMTFSRSENS